MKNKAILVTGAAGCIGSNFCQWLVDNQPDWTIIALDDLSGGYPEFVPKECAFYKRDAGSDLTDIFVKYDVRIIYHAAAIAAEALSPFRRCHYYQNNIVVSANIINHAIKYNVNRLVYFSSMAVYGKNFVPFTEDQIPEPIDPYGIGKYAVEMDLKCAAEQHGLKYTIVRPHSVYGPKQNVWDAYRNVIGIWMRQILNDEPISIYGDGSQRRAFTYIDDILEPLWICGTSEKTIGETFNIGSDDDMRLIILAKYLGDVVGDGIEKKYYPAIHEVKNAWSDHSKAKQLLGFECTTPIHIGLEKMWKWLKNEPIRRTQTFSEFELEEGLYPQFKSDKK